MARYANNLSRALQAPGEYAAAWDAYQRALAIFEEALEPDHPNRRLVRRNLERLERLMEEEE